MIKKLDFKKKALRYQLYQTKRYLRDFSLFVIFILVFTVSGCFHAFQTAETVDGYSFGVASTIPPDQSEGGFAAMARLGKAATEKSFGIEGGLQFGWSFQTLECGGCPRFSVEPMLIGNTKVQLPTRIWFDIATNIDFMPYYVICPWNLSFLASKNIGDIFTVYGEYEWVNLFPAFYESIEEERLELEDIDSNIILGVKIDPFKHVSLLIEGEWLEGKDNCQIGCAIVIYP